MIKKVALLTLALFCAAGISWAAQNSSSPALYGSKKAFTTGKTKVRHIGEVKRPRTADVIQKYSGLAKTAGGPDSFGYTFKDSNEPGGPAFTWVDITSTGTNTGLGDDEYYYSIPFDFTFYGATYSNIAIGSNGTVYFEDNYLGNGNTSIPSTNGYGVNIFTAVYWMDIDPSSGGGVYYQVIGNTLVVEWYQVPVYGTSDYLTFEVILNNSDNTIKFQYLTLDDPGNYCTVGIQGSPTEPPLWGLQYMYADASLSNNLAIQFEQYIPTSHDVKVASIDTPATVMTPSVAFSPTATIKNPGLSPESDFQVFFQINDSLGTQIYLDSVALTSPDSLLPDSLRQFVFANNFTPDQWTKYTAVAWTGLADDYSWNDTLSKPFRTWDLDISTEEILNPLGSANPDPDIIPTVVFHNAGTQTADFNATFQVTYGGSLMYDVTLNIAGLAGGSDTTIEFPAWPGVRLEGTYQMTAYAEMSHDLNKANDTISGTLNSGYNIWVSKAPLNNVGQLYCAAVAPWNGRVYLFGGAPDGTFSNTIQYFDTLTNVWDTVATTMPTNLFGASAITLGDRIFVIGGCETWANPLTTVYCYWPDGDSLTVKASLPTATMEAAVGLWRDSLIYIMGGGNWTMTQISNVQIYNVADDSWAAGTPMPGAVGTNGGGICGDTIISVGGYVTNVCYYGVIDTTDPASITWSTGTPYPTYALIRPSTAVLNHKLYVAAGYDDSDPLADAYYYTPADDAWTQLPDKTTATIGAGQAAMVGEWMYVIAGETSGNNEALYLGSSEAVDPVITATSPADGESDIDVAGPVVITFSKSMDTTAVIYSCIPDPGNMTAAWNYDCTIMTVSHDSFAYSTNYSFMVTAGQSLDGYNLKAGSVPDSFGFGTVVSGVSGQPFTSGVPYFLASAAPNPMGSGQTTIAFGLPRSSQVRIEVYNIAGQRVKTLVNDNMSAGYHKVSWNGRNSVGQKVANGVYMYRMSSGDYTATRKLLIVK